MDAHFPAYGTHIRRVDQPLKTVGGCDLHLIVDSLKDQVGTHAGQRPLIRAYQVNILGADDHVHRRVGAETFIHAGEPGAEDLHQLIPYHCAVDDVALSDKVSHESIFRLVVDLLRSPHLLDISLIHDHNGVRHGQGLFLVVGHVDEGDAQLIFQAYQLVLHILAQL